MQMCLEKQINRWPACINIVIRHVTVHVTQIQQGWMRRRFGILLPTPAINSAFEFPPGNIWSKLM
jgi:hypothetical protein